MHPSTEARPRKAPVSIRHRMTLRDIWHDVGFRSWAYQIIVVFLIVGTGVYLIGNAQDALARRGISTGFDFLFRSAGFDIGEAPIAFKSTDSFLWAYAAGVLNTLKVSLIAIVFATIIGVLIGIARLSSNILVRMFASGYVELFRNTPQLLQLVFWYAIINQLPLAGQAISLFDMAYISNRGLVMPWPADSTAFALTLGALAFGCAGAAALLRWGAARRRRTGQALSLAGWSAAVVLGAPLATWIVQGAPTAFEIPQLQGFNFRGGVSISPEFLALLLGLSLYIASFIAEIVRSGIQSVSRGQIEAACAIGLKPSDIYRKIVLPQALRVMVPPASAQYVSLVKNSSLGVAIGYPELFNINNTIITLSGHTIEAIGIMMAIYLSISLIIAALMNLYNRSVQIKER